VSVGSTHNTIRERTTETLDIRASPCYHTQVHMTTIILRIIANSLALYLATLLVPNFLVSGGIKEYALAGLVLALLNMLVRPLLKLISLPFIIITFGLFTVAINAFMIWLVDVSFDFVSIETFMALFWATMIVSAVNILTAHTT